MIFLVEKIVFYVRFWPYAERHIMKSLDTIFKYTQSWRNRNEQFKLFQNQFYVLNWLS